MFLVFEIGCSKKTTDTPNTNQPNNNDAPCSIPSNSFTIAGVPYLMSKDTSFPTSNGTYFFVQAQHNETDGCSIEFNGNNIPKIGKYQITAIYQQVKGDSTKVFVQFYKDSVVMLCHEGKVEVLQGNTGLELQFCDKYFKNGFGDTARVSSRCNMNNFSNLLA
jgi:hypothetical protein